MLREGPPLILHILFPGPRVKGWTSWRTLKKRIWWRKPKVL